MSNSILVPVHLVLTESIHLFILQFGICVEFKVSPLWPVYSWSRKRHCFIAMQLVGHFLWVPIVNYCPWIVMCPSFLPVFVLPHWDTTNNLVFHLGGGALHPVWHRVEFPIASSRHFLDTLAKHRRPYMHLQLQAETILNIMILY